jgi:hypothetical protein
MRKTRKAKKAKIPKGGRIAQPKLAERAARQEAKEIIRPISMADLVWTLPLFDDVYLSMQGQNVMLVDFYLRDLEHNLLVELIRLERTPFDSAVFVSAISQMWIFAAYELLRTWRQRIRDLKRDAAKPAPVAEFNDDDGDLARASEHMRQAHLERVRQDNNYVAILDEAMERVEPVFRRIESLRMNLAKHEVPRRKGLPAMAPGYGRISHEDGSFYWMIDLGDNEVDMVSRRGLADALRRAAIGRDIGRELGDDNGR